MVRQEVAECLCRPPVFGRQFFCLGQVLGQKEREGPTRKFTHWSNSVYRAFRVADVYARPGQRNLLREDRLDSQGIVLSP